MNGIRRFRNRRGNEADGFRMLKFSAFLRRRLQGRRYCGTAIFHSCQSVGAQCLVMFLTMLAFSTPALADGGAVRLREAAGPFLVTVFTTPAAPQAGRVDVSVMVQSGDKGEALLDAEVDLQFVSPPGTDVVGREIFCTPDGTQLRVGGAGDQSPRPIAATQKQATNKLLYAARVNLPAAGDWQMRVRVRRGLAEAQVNCALPVVAAGAGLASVWPFIVTPLLLVGVFICHQRLRRRARSGLQIMSAARGTTAALL